MQVVRKLKNAVQNLAARTGGCMRAAGRAFWKTAVVEVFFRPTKAQLKHAAAYLGKMSEVSAIAGATQLGAIQLGLVKLTFWAIAVGLELFALAVGCYVASSMLIRRS